MPDKVTTRVPCTTRSVDMLLEGPNPVNLRAPPNKVNARVPCATRSVDMPLEWPNPVNLHTGETRVIPPLLDHKGLLRREIVVTQLDR